MQVRVKCWCCVGLLPAVVAAVGCAAGAGPKVTPTPLAVSQEPPSQAASVRDPTAPATLFVRTEVRHFEVPAGEISNDAKFWATVDTTAVGAELSAQLLRNGWQVGIAAADAWPALRARLDAKQPLSSEKATDSASGAATEWLTNEQARDLTLFRYSDSGELAGMDLADVRTALIMTPYIAADAETDVLLQILPIVRADDSKRTFVPDATGLRSETTYDTLPLADQAVELRVAAGHFVVIGPAGDVDTLAGSGSGVHRTLTGQVFLTRRRGDARSESIVLVVPQVFRTPGSGRR